MIDYLKRLVTARIERVSPEENFFISAGMEFYGDLVARSSSGRIDGRFEGHIIECRKIIIGPDAVIKGNIFADDILLYGYCEGNLFATGDVKVFNSAVILGDIHTSSLLVEREASFRGNVKKLKSEEMSAFALSEKDRIIRQGKSNVHNIYSLQAKAEQEAHRVRKVANGSVDIDYPAASGMKKLKKLDRMEAGKNEGAVYPVSPTPVDSQPQGPTHTTPLRTSEEESEASGRRWF